MKTAFTLLFFLLFLACSIENSFAQGKHVIVLGVEGPLPAQAIATSNYSRSLVQLYDSIYYWNWHTPSNAWEIDPWAKRINFTYDANDNLTGDLVQIVNGTWTNADKHTYTYNPNNKKLTELHEQWYNNAWMNQVQYSFTYDANNNLTSKLMQWWDWVSSWQDDQRNQYIYDLNNNLVSEVYQTWNNSDTVWENFRQYIYSYDANNNMLNTLQQVWTGSSWLNYEQYVYSYDVGNNLISGIRQNWNNSVWSTLNQITYVNDTDGNRINESWLSWNGSIWINFRDYKWTYNTDNFATVYTFQQYNPNGVTVTGDSIIYYYHTVIGINEPSQEDAFIIFPNPVTDKFEIRNSKSEIYQIEIFNSLGEKVFQSHISYLTSQVSVDISQLPSGIYFVKVKDRQQQRVAMFIKE